MSTNTDTVNATDTDDIETTSTPAEPAESTETDTAAVDSGTALAVIEAGGLDTAAAEVFDAELMDEPAHAHPLEVSADLLDFDVPEDEPRYDLTNDPEFVESVRMWGVLEPVTVFLAPGGRWRVARGRRRVLAAQATGQPVPIVVRGAGFGSDPESMIQTLAQEIHTNDRRIDYTRRERANRWAQMSLYGASVTRIARDTAHKRDEVKAALTAVDSRTAMDAVESGQFTFEQAAVIAEYEQAGDDDAVIRLMQTPTSLFGAEARRIAADREQITEQMRESLAYAERGYSFVVREPGEVTTQLPDGEYLHTDELRTPDGREITPEIIAAEPSLWTVFLEVEPESVATDTQTGEEVDFAEIDWGTRYHRSADAEEGLRHFDSVTLHDTWEPVYWLASENLTASGLVIEDAFAPGLAPDADDEGHDSVGEDRDQDAEAAAAAAAEAAETARREAQEQREENARKRNMVIALNIAGDSAKAERCEFVAGLLSRKTLPMGAAAFVAESLLIEPELINRHLAQASALELLGFGDTDRARKHNEDASANRSLVLVYALVLGAHEARIDKSHWRADAQSWWGDGPGYRRYLLHLAEQGHTLTPVEQVTAGHIALTDIDIDALRAEQKAEREEQKALAAAA